MSQKSYTHTPGPWGRYDQGPSIIIYAQSATVAEIPLEQFPYPTTSANIALIRSAPELMEALKSLLAATARPGTPEQAAAIEQAEAAIKAATPKTPYS